MNGIPTTNQKEEKARERGVENVSSVDEVENAEMNCTKIAAKVKKARSFMELSVQSKNSTQSVETKSEWRVLVLYTGGTIGMVKNKNGVLIPQRGMFENLIRGYPQLHDNALWKQKLAEPGFDTSFLALPEAKDFDLRIFYKIIEYDNLLDSSNMSEKEWIKIAEDIMKHYEEYDGFVVLHGTDTLSYTASALSFMFENIGKAIILTGSQIPICEPRSDGIDNFVSSLLIAGGLNIPEVTVFFGSKLFRGNRTSKISVNNLYAFDSPNCVPLVEVGIDFAVNKKAIFKPTVIEKCHLHANMSKNVGLLRIFPSISSSVIKAFCQPPIEGVVLESYGAGNIPSNRQDVFSEVAASVRRGVIVVNITQCGKGAVATPLYETGEFLAESGVISGFDMTPEAALTKLSYVLSKTELTYQQKVELMATNIRGEMTNPSSIPVEEDFLIDTLATSLNIQSPKKLIEVTEKVYNALLLYAIEHGDERGVKKMLDMGADVNSPNSEGRTALHEAVVKGNVAIIGYLLKNGANVHLKTRSGESPLLTAVSREDLPIIELLRQCGAHVAAADTRHVAELLSLAARRGARGTLVALRAAGADLSLTDELRQSALHKAVLCNQPEVVSYLLENGVRSDEQDLMGNTPLDCALTLGHQHIVHMFNKYND